MLEWIADVYDAYMHQVPGGLSGVYWPLDTVLLGSAIGLIVGAIIGYTSVRVSLLLRPTQTAESPFEIGRRRLSGRVVLATALVGSMLGGVVLGAVIWIV